MDSNNEKLRGREGRPKKRRIPLPNPIESAVAAWLAQSELGPPLPCDASDGVVQQQKSDNEVEEIAQWPADGSETKEAGVTFASRSTKGSMTQAPKRWTIYEPMVLLPAGSFSSPSWTDILASASSDGERRTDDLWRNILREISRRSSSKTALSHLAVNEGIPSRNDVDNGSSRVSENILRSPDGLRMLYGDFGPSEIFTSGGITQAEFSEAFWVSTKQNGIYQTWAPRWTMFSRGNIKEKARLLDFHNGQDTARREEQEAGRTGEDQILDLRRTGMPKTKLTDYWAVDLYAGIGYFVFSYAKLDMRVLCWELNPWSVEGLRRGAQANGWSVKVVQGHDLDRPIEEAFGEEQIVVFLEDNQHAVSRIHDLRRRATRLSPINILHVNCGLLPTSELRWKDAWSIARNNGEGGEAWLHLHENVGVENIAKRRDEVDRLFDELSSRVDDGPRLGHVEHVELVKTYAPGVWHCVFDVKIKRPSGTT